MIIFYIQYKAPEGGAISEGENGVPGSRSICINTDESYLMGRDSFARYINFMHVLMVQNLCQCVASKYE